MPRKKTKSLVRDIQPDRLYNSVPVQRLINRVMLNGKKQIAERLVYGGMEKAAKKLKVGEKTYVYYSLKDAEQNGLEGISSLPVHHALIRSTPVGEWDLSCVFPKEHAFAAKRSISPRDILAQRIIAFSPDTPQGRVIQQWCEETGLQPQSRIEVRSGQAACSLAACGAGVAVVDDFTARAWRDPRLSFRPVRTSPHFPIFALFHATAPTSTVTNTFVDHVRQCHVAQPEIAAHIRVHDTIVGFVADPRGHVGDHRHRRHPQAGHDDRQCEGQLHAGQQPGP